MDARPLALSPTTMYIAAGAIVVAIAIVAWVIVRLRHRRPKPRRSPYVDGLTRLIDGDAGGAFERLQQAVRAGNAPPDAYVRLGRMLRDRGEAGRALQLHKGLTVREDLTREEKVAVFVEIAEDYAALGVSDQAVSVLETAVRRMGLRDGEVYRILSREAHRLGRADVAYQYLKEWKKVGGIGDRELALYLTTVGVSQMDNGNEREGRKSLDRALKHHEECAPALLALGDDAERRGETRRAIERWRQAVRLSQELAPAALRRLERATFLEGTFSEMEGVYGDVLAAHPDDEAAVTSLAGFYRKQGRGQEAIDLLTSFRISHPAAIAPTMLLASIYAGNRDSEAIERLFEETESVVGRPAGFRCRVCGFQHDTIRWHCPTCNEFDSFENVAS